MLRQEGSSHYRCLALDCQQAEEAVVTTARTVGRTALGTARTTAGQIPLRRRTQR